MAQFFCFLQGSSNSAQVRFTPDNIFFLMKSSLIFLQKHISHPLFLSKILILLSALLLDVFILHILPLIVSSVFCLLTKYFSGQTLDFKKVENLKKTTLINMATVNVPQKILWKMSKGHSKPCQMETHLQFHLASSSLYQENVLRTWIYFFQGKPWKMVTALDTNSHYSGCKRSKTGEQRDIREKDSFYLSTLPNNGDKEGCSRTDICTTSAAPLIDK